MQFYKIFLNIHTIKQKKKRKKEKRDNAEYKSGNYMSFYCIVTSPPFPCPAGLKTPAGGSVNKYNRHKLYTYYALFFM